MKCRIKLKCTKYQEDQTINLNNIYPNFSEDYLCDKFLLFEDAAYEASILLEDCTDPVEQVLVYLNDTVIGKGIKKESKSNNYFISFNNVNNGFAQPFLLQCDLVILSVKIVTQEQTTFDFYSPYLLCVSKNEEDAENVNCILKELTEIEDEKICKWLFPSNTDENSITSMLEGKLRRKSYKSIFSYIQLLKTIINCYQKYYTFFKSIPQKKISTYHDLETFDKIDYFSSNEFQWMTKNLDQLNQVQHKTGIEIDNQYYLPSNVFVEKKESSSDIYENRIVCSFLTFIRKELQVLKNEFENDVFEEEKIINRLTQLSFQGYHSPIVSIKKIHIKYNKQLLNELDDLFTNITNLETSYYRTLKCKKVLFQGIPRRTKIFQNVSTYRVIYDLIVKWYQFGEFTLEKDRIVFRVKTLDKLFEYYCLCELLKMLSEAGFDIVDVENDITTFKYETNDGLYQNETDFANTYKMTNKNTQVILYYQPVIYANKFANNISLFRTTSKEKYFSPDFLLKFTSEAKNKYFIFDSKYASRNSIIDYRIDDAIMKYTVQVQDSNDLNSIKMMWLLQGRIDGKKAIYNYNDSPISLHSQLPKSIGIVSLNTKINSRKQFWNEINSMLLR